MTDTYCITVWNLNMCLVMCYNYSWSPYVIQLFTIIWVELCLLFLGRYLTKTNLHRLILWREIFRCKRKELNYLLIVIWLEAGTCCISKSFLTSLFIIHFLILLVTDAYASNIGILLHGEKNDSFISDVTVTRKRISSLSG